MRRKGTLYPLRRTEKDGLNQIYRLPAPPDRKPRATPRRRETGLVVSSYGCERYNIARSLVTDRFKMFSGVCLTTSYRSRFRVIYLAGNTDWRVVYAPWQYRLTESFPSLLASSLTRARERAAEGNWFRPISVHSSERAAYNASVFVVIRMSTNNACPVIIDDIWLYRPGHSD